jgi:hypothetical protein
MWLAAMEESLRKRLETAFHDEVMIEPLVSQLRQRKDGIELLRDLLHIATTRTSLLYRVK